MLKIILIAIVPVAIFGNYAWQIAAFLRRREKIERGADSGWSEAQDDYE